MWLIVGLGNPGSQYVRTRHNIGFEVVATLAERHQIALRGKRANSLIGEGRIGEQRVALVQPQTYMNLSGQAVAALCNWYKIEPARALLVVYDDMDIPFGRMRFRERGSGGTHNGMRSIIGQLGANAFPRLRVGIGQSPGKMDAAAYVLSRFSQEEQPQLSELLERSADALELMLCESLTTAMNRYNPT
ncbi:MAG: aminoacyl-tRNA hydrolase [Candidatus Viridilinea halotolerans]|uniref:Peptidyl-tRNA hydrolase n=1 Tax=Candidatus Viridilinea halotolerans TaxID=2491704 RepID=A0A426TWW4_9CHLR|nr:MAG: aminoacyl-tRNA hydrolase [Candidatus Viridilinea halotolerans]